MVTGDVMFRGSPAEVMYQHQHAPLPLERLKDVPQPIVVLLEKLLEKDPGQRFQTPNELLKAIPTITGAVDARRRITRSSLEKILSNAAPVVSRKLPTRLAPKKISVARLPVTGSDIFGREEDISFLDRAWANKDVNVVTIVAWAGVGKSTLINHWLRQMAAKHYRSAQLVFGWSFYRQGTSGGTSSADEFLDAALSWFGDPDPRIGTQWEKGERLANLIAHSRTLLILDGLEPLQNPTGPQEGRVREPSLQALLRELAAFNPGLCVITTRTPVADIADYERASALRRDLEQLSRDAGAKLLRALSVNGREAELRTASDEFGGHCLALTLLGSYLADAYNGDIRYRTEVSERLGHDIRQGAHARKVMESYQTWFGEGPELSVLRMLGLFDRPADDKALGALLRPPAIRGLTESLTDLTLTELRTILSRLRRAKLLAGEDPHTPGHLDTHPLVREYFGEQLRTQRTEAWKECNRRLAYFAHNPAEVERIAWDLIELSTRQTFATFLPLGAILRGWARSASGDTTEGISRIEDGIGDYRATGSILNMPNLLALKAEGLHLANRTSEALEAIKEAEALVERSEERWWCAELHRLRAVFLAAMAAEETQIETAFCAAIGIATEQKSVSLQKRAQATYAEYRRQKASGLGGHGFRLPL
jgi:NACHT domain